MFDFVQHGLVETHNYRSYYDAQPGSTTKCAFCGHIIRYCYVMTDQYGKTFVIGSCDFDQYKTCEKVFVLLQAARLMQGSFRENIVRDQKTYRADVQQRRKEWVVARREGMKLVRTWRNTQGEWLPKPLYELQIAVQLKPRQYKIPTCARRWYEHQTEKILHLTKEATTI